MLEREENGKKVDWKGKPNEREKEKQQQKINSKYGRKLKAEKEQR